MPQRQDSPQRRDSPHGAAAPPSSARRVYATLSESMRYTSPGVSGDVDEPLLIRPLSHTSSSEPGTSMSLASVWAQIATKFGFSPPRRELPPSGLYTILPLSDSRLQPQRTILLLVLLGALALAVVVGVFLLVPRGVTVGEVTFTPHTWRRNATEQSYSLKLDLEIPVKNPNFYASRIEGQLSVMFYSVEAGRVDLMGGEVIAARSFDTVLNITVDASNVPEEYSVTVLETCKLLPKKLIFFFLANLTATSFMQREELPAIKTYFTVDCSSNSGSRVPGLPPSGAERGQAPSLLAAAPRR